MDFECILGTLKIGTTVISGEHIETDITTAEVLTAEEKKDG